MTKLGKHSSALALAILTIGLLSISTPDSNAAQPVVSTAPYPIAFQFSLRIDPSNNHWFVNVTNIGNRALSQFGVLLFNSSGYEITANSTALIGVRSVKPTDVMKFKTVCSDYYYSGAPCTFRSDKSYGISVVAWVGSCSCDHEIDITGNVLANNQVYSFSTYPMIALSSTSMVTSTNWSLSISNSGTKTARASAGISWTWTPCNSPSGCYGGRTTGPERISSGSSIHVNLAITKPHKASPRTHADIWVIGNYANIAYHGWSAQLTMSQSPVVRK